ncbi:MAG: hypothetical protein WBA97_24075 [Actinophytocola sp.]|uniref:hypothetical protein n=1 Tax=Actinophytocola sp. TaxID=1872138 RepID=UPI003C71FE76
MSGRLEQTESYRRLEKMGSPTPHEGTGGGFAYDEATLRSLVTKWTELADRYLASSKRVSTDAIIPPGLDFASKGQAEASTNANKAYYQYVVTNYWYCVKQAQLLQDTLDDYLDQEHQSVIEINKSGPGPQAGI